MKLRFKFCIMTLFLILASFGALADEIKAQESFLEKSESSFISLNDAKLSNDDINGLSYSSFRPSIKDPKGIDRQLEVFSGVITSDRFEKSDVIEWVKNELIIDGSLNKNKKLPIEILSLSELDNDPELLEIVNEIKKVAPNALYKHEVPPYAKKIKGLKVRSPDSDGTGLRSLTKKALNHNLMLSLIRMGANGGATALGIVLEKGPLFMSQGVTMGVVNGSMSLFLQLFNKPFGNWLINGKTTERFMQSIDSVLARQDLDAQSRSKIKNMQTNFLLKLKDVLEKNGQSIEEFAKWGGTEVVYSSIVKTTAISQSLSQFKLGAYQAIYGLSGYFEVNTIADLLFHSALGMFAQGPLDIAIHKVKTEKLKLMLTFLNMLEESNKSYSEINKYIDTIKSKGDRARLKGIFGEFSENMGMTKSLDQLKTELQVMFEGKKVVSNVKKTRWAKFLDAISVSGNVHEYIRSVQTWANTRAVLISMVQVSALGMSMAGVPIGKPMLLGLGLFGMAYSGSTLKGWTWKGSYKAALGIPYKSVQTVNKIMDGFIQKVQRSSSYGYPKRLCWRLFN